MYSHQVQQHADAQSWVTELRSMVGESIQLAIAANKSDLERQRAVPADVAEAYAKSIGAAHVSTSAKVNRGVEKAFLDLSRRLVAAGKANATRASSSSSSGGGVRIVDDDVRATPSAKSSKCCS